MSKPLSNTQLEILESFRFEMSESQLKDFRQVLIDYFAASIDAEMDRLFEEKGWSVDEKVTKWGKEHMRTPYKN
ncbi:MAG: hypothetical protein AAGF87_03370 [Bacteroidota bacterium]